MTTTQRNGLLILIGGLLLLLYFIAQAYISAENILRFIALVVAQCGLYIAAVRLIWRIKPAPSGATSAHSGAASYRSTLILIILFGILFRLTLLWTTPRLSDDIYRYIWDGRVQAAGINPYRYVPEDKALETLRDDEVFARINRRNYAHTIYPPGAQMIFFLATRISERVTWMKAVMVGFELLTLWALLQLLSSWGLPKIRALIFLWHPLAVWEFAGSGHLDAAVLAFVTLALLARRYKYDGLTGLALAGATLIKLYPVALFPALYRRWNWRMPVVLGVTCGLAYLPYIGVGAGVFGYLPGYAQEEGLRDGNRFFLLSVLRRLIPVIEIPNAAFIGLAGVALGSLALWCLFRRETDERDFVRRALLLAAACTVLLSPHYTWYFSWLLPFLCFVASPAVFYLTAASFVLYATWQSDAPDRVFVMNTLIYLPCALLLAAFAFWRRRSFGDNRLPTDATTAAQPN